VTPSIHLPSQNALSSAWQRWVYLPQSVPVRKVLFQIHLWLGIIIGLYICMISMTGSAAVFYRDLAVTPWVITHTDASRVMEWVVDLHENLLFGELGRAINGVAAIIVGVLVLAGLVIWWPGRRRWRQSLIFFRPTRTHRFSWHLHSAIGFWSAVLLFAWAVTGIYFAYPGLFEPGFMIADISPPDFERPGEGLLAALIRLHYGHFGGLSIQMLWVVLGLLPALLFITGFIVWWKRVIVRGRLSRRSILGVE